MTTKCPNGGCDVCALGGDCRTYGHPSPLPAGLDTLDFEKAFRVSREAVAAIWEVSPKVVRGIRDKIPSRVRAALNAQVAEIVQRTREEERAKVAPLVTLVRRFQETVAVVKAEVGTPLTDEVHVHGREYAEAHAALEAFDLDKEGDK